jgi:hypothetical protein
VVFLDGSVKDLPATVIVYSFSVTPQVIPSGGTATLTWSAEGASKVTLDEEPVAVQGSKTVTLTRTTTHALRIVFPDNSTQDLTSSVMVYSFSVSPKYIRRGESATLQWNAEGASKVTLDSQEMAVRGSRVVTPTQTTKYPLRVVFPGGSTRDLSATVTVVSCSFMATPQFIGTNESSRLEWNCPEASERTLDGQKVTAQGARVVAPTQTTAYTFRATFPDGSTKDLETAVTVGQGPCEPLRYDALGYKHVTPTLLQTEITATPSIRIPNEFAHPDNTVILQGDEIICLASTPDGTGELKVDDQIHFSVMPSNKNWVHDFYDPVTKGIKFYPAQNVTWTFAKGENRLKLILTDKIQGYYSTTNIWLIVWSRQ